MRISIARGKRAILFLVLVLSFFMTARAQVSPDPSRKKGMDLLQKNLRATGLNRSTLDAYRVTDAYADKRSGNFIVYLQQTWQGIPVYNKIGVYVFRNDTLIEKRPNFIGRIEAIAPVKTAAASTKPFYNINAGQAIRSAANHLSIPVRQEPRLVRKDELSQHFLYSPDGVSRQSISSDLVWLPVNDGKAIRLSWNVRIASPDGHDDWFVRVDAQSGEVLEKSSLVVSEKDHGVNEPLRAPAVPFMTPDAQLMAPATSKKILAVSTARAALAPPPPAVTSASYRVYPFPLESGNYGSRILDLNPWLRAGAGNNAIALGWHFDNTTNYEYTRGNNVWAQQDLTGTSATTGFADTSTAAIPSLLFDRNIDAALSPSDYSNIRAGMDNLFYWNNIMHDISYQYGFDEAAGNFQAANLGRGGQGNDYVNAFAEDGAGMNNADFATPPDGENPRMRMFQWNTAVTTHFHVNSPAPIAIDYTVVEGSFTLKNQLTSTGPVTADIVQVDDNPAGTHLGCGLFNNTAALAGKIALIDRGSCNFSVKIKDAQNAGAIAVIVVNSVAGAPTGMSGTDATITIPAVMIGMSDGAILKANLSGLNGSLSAIGQNRDGALDNGVMAHEYTHGISNRLTGGPANADCLANAEQMGEGWSDYVALMVTTDWSAAALTDGTKKRPIGTYVMAQPATGAGIRTYPYSTDMAVNPWTYGMLATNTAGEPHAIGEIWCAAIWDMTWNIIQQEGIDPDIYHGTKGNNIALQLVLQGMKLQPCSPGFLDARDAILKADSILYNYAHKCAIWHAFARRGMGRSALQGSSNSYIDQTAATDLPSGMGITQTVDKASLAQGDNITYTIKAYCDCSPLTNISIVDTLSGNLTYVSSPGGTYTAPSIRFDALNFAENETKTFTIQAKVTGGYALPDTLINDSQDPSGYSWTQGILVGGTNFTASTARSHSPSHTWYAKDQATPTDFTLQSNDLVLDTISTLSFWHYFETDGTYDGGIVEISTDGGSSWQDLGPYMTQNAYNNTMDPAATGIPNRKAFAGSSGGGFIQTVVSLTGYAGRTARIRFRFTSDNFDGSDGWYIDDILLKNERGAVSSASAFSGSTLLSRTNAFALFAPVALPVNFQSFTATRKDKSAWLQWVVNEEVNVANYIVERSADGSRYTAIGEVPASAASSGEKEYSFTDGHPLDGNNFYRIVEKDLDGKSTVSVTKLLNFTGSSLFIRLSPVPTFTHAVQLELATADDGPISASLINTLGQTIKIYAVKQGTNLLDLENFSRGIYYLKIQTGRNKAEIRKIVIQ